MGVDILSRLGYPDDYICRWDEDILSIEECLGDYIDKDMLL
jgi:hypothetical protein